MKFTLKPQHNQASAITDGFMLLKSPLLNKPARLDILTCRSLPDLKVATDPLILVRYPKICNDPQKDDHLSLLKAASPSYVANLGQLFITFNSFFLIQF